MSGRVSATRFVLPALMVGLMACAGPNTMGSQSQGAPKDLTYNPSGFDPVKDSYWEDPRWQKTLLDTLQQAVHDPQDTSDVSTPGLHATVKFTFENGDIEYPEVISGTGNADLDALMLRQVAAVRVPLPTSGLQTDQAHEFELDLDMPTPLETFESTVYYAIGSWRVYPKDAIIAGEVGETTVAFDYQDGKASNIVLTTSSKSKDLDRSSITAVTKAALPAAPAAYAGRSLHMEMVFCYTLLMSDYGATPVAKYQCPAASNVIVTTGTRIKRVEVTHYH